MEGKKVKSLHVEINMICHQHNFTTLSNKYDKWDTKFPGDQKM